MAITAYSKTFDREIDVKQLRELHTEFVLEKGLEANFTDFVTQDIICSCCKVDGAIPIKPSFSKITNCETRQEHFAFRRNGMESHSIFCDHYSTPNPTVVKNEGNIDFSKSNKPITIIIRKFICAAIENKIFTQSDITNMRAWFLDMRSQQDFLIKDHSLYLNVLYTIHSRRRNKKTSQDLFRNPENSDEIIPLKAYKALAQKIDSSNIDFFLNGKDLTDYLSKKTMIEKAISLSKENMGKYHYNIEKLDEKYKVVTYVAQKIISLTPSLMKIINRDFITPYKYEHIMAYAAILLFISNWDHEQALEKHKNVTKISHVNDETLGNVIGLNPFNHYHAWYIVKFINEWQGKFDLFEDINAEFEAEKQRIKEYYDLD